VRSIYKYIVKRLLVAVPIVFFVTMLVFVLMRITPGDPVLIMLGTEGTPETYAALRTQLGLDQPIYVQYLKYLERLLKGDLGTDIRTKRPVLVEILERLPATLELAFWGLAIAIVIGIPAGIISAVKAYSKFDYISTFVSLLGVSMPWFWLGIILMVVFSYYLGLTPVSGYGTIAHLVLPSITLGTGFAAIIMRLTRSSMLEVWRQDYLTVARSKGLRERTIIFKHALRNALMPVVTVIGLNLGGLIGGAFILEEVFAWPGIGRLTINAVLDRNYPVVQGAVLVTCTSFILANLVIDILYAYLDPRVRYE
jgi:ABC-type dipeptide/oligopeptide/nickel transport system permease component